MLALDSQPAGYLSVFFLTAIISLRDDPLLSYNEVGIGGLVS